jgi:hypothetical protein
MDIEDLVVMKITLNFFNHPSMKAWHIFLCYYCQYQSQTSGSASENVKDSEASSLSETSDKDLPPLLEGRFPAVPMYGPIMVRNLSVGQVKLVCRCGLSKRLPWCDSKIFSETSTITCLISGSPYYYYYFIEPDDDNYYRLPFGNHHQTLSMDRAGNTQRRETTKHVLPLCMRSFTVLSLLWHNAYVVTRMTLST